jgi:hypothetical protein
MDFIERAAKIWGATDNYIRNVFNTAKKFFDRRFCRRDMPFGNMMMNVMTRFGAYFQESISIRDSET